MRKVIIISGPPGAGKDTVAKALAGLLYRCVIINVDDVGQMVVKPHIAPWYGGEGKEQAKLGAKNAMQLAKNFLQDDFNVIITDVLSQEIWNMYKDFHSQDKSLIFTLLPSLKECIKRNGQRHYSIAEKRITELNSVLASNPRGVVIDNTDLPPEKVAAKLYSPTFNVGTLS